ncbi:SRPBCC family protein [Smaragdicoccus niigatensis]|uniref:SRPBCC family protein n=1 Tax=Smaragdicoccus niigatensis TaxID=359359 RepID=UPI000382E706|nr:SRPBCC family protein [Smaragdicoccus niigatensis]
MRDLTVSDSVVVNGVDPMTAYRAVSDVAQMGRWSPENTGAKVATKSLVVGDTFDGSNKRGPILRWVGRARVTTAEPGSVFIFRTEGLGLGLPWLRHPGRRPGIASWEYRFEAVEGGTRVTETWHDERPWPDLLAAAADPILTGSRTFADFQRRNIATTLARLKADLESR